MRRVLAVGALCLALGMASCRTYCPAYSDATPDNKTKVNVSATAAEGIPAKVNS